VDKVVHIYGFCIQGMAQAASEVMAAFLAGVEGAVRRVLVEDAELVEYDQPLFLIEPA